MTKESAKKINILEIHSSMSYAGGGQRNVFTFCKYLNRDIFNVYAGSYLVGGAQEARFAAIGVECVVGDGRPEKVLNFIKDKKIDILHIHRSGHYVPLESAIIEGAKHINSEIFIIEKNVFGKFDPQSSKFVDCSFFQSKMHLNERYLPASGQKFDFNRMKVLYNSVDNNYLKNFSASAEEINIYKQKLGIAETDFVIGKIASSHIAKWSDLVIDVMPYLVRLIPNIKFVIVGVPDSRLRKINQSKYRDKYILFKQITDEKEERLFYQAIDVLAHSSKIGECNGNAINEAMYWGKPVVVNSTPKKDNGQLEQVEHMVNGIVANYPQTFARAIEYLFKNVANRGEMGARAHHQAMHVNNPVNIVGQLEKYILEKYAAAGQISGSNLNKYKDLTYQPTETEIFVYREKYREKLCQEFGELSFTEKAINLLNKPWKFYIKIRDFIEHRLGV